MNHLTETARRWPAAIGLAGLVLSIVALSVALMVTIDRASLHFRRAAIAQAQFAAVLGIERLVDGGANAAAIDDALQRYRRLIAQESALVPVEQRGAQGREAAAARRLAAIVGAAAGTERGRAIDAIVATTVARERGEAADAAQAMGALRARTWWIAGLLMLAALGSAALGGAGLFAANRRLSREVARRTAEIAAIDASRRLFFAKASHELRTPVTVMRGEAEVAMADPGGERAALAHVVAQAEFLEHRIAELLALAQAEDGRIPLVRAPCEVGEIAAAACAAVAGYARSNDVALAIERADVIGVEGDRRWLEQALVAVLDNAVKFSPTGGVVRIAVARAETCAVVTIVDDGAGVVAAALPRVFDAFYQADPDPGRGGSGLGLALARWVVESHGGNIEAASGTGGGCTITISLPMRGSAPVRA